MADIVVPHGLDDKECAFAHRNVAFGASDLHRRQFGCRRVLPLVL